LTILQLICEGGRIRTYLMVKRFYRPPPFHVGLHPHIFVYVGPFKASSRYTGYMVMRDSIYNAEGGFSRTTPYKF